MQSQERENRTEERPLAAASGFGMLVVTFGLFAATVALFVAAAPTVPEGERVHVGYLLAGFATLLAAILTMPGYFTVPPNTARVLSLFGAYKGVVRDAGFRWTNPFMTKRSVSLRAQTMNGEKLKVNDKAGNPIEIAAVVVWRVRNPAQAVFDVENCESFVQVQSETALRHLASIHPYDGGSDEDPSLRGSADVVAQELARELTARLERAGVEVIEARLSHLAYAPEIAGAMLRRQQAAAVIAARQRIVEGAVGMVEMALADLAKREVVHLDDERKAAMISNLLVVLCSEQAAQPVLNTGTLYS